MMPQKNDGVPQHFSAGIPDCQASGKSSTGTGLKKTKYAGNSPILE
jgi:hypothetical protein